MSSEIGHFIIGAVSLTAAVFLCSSGQNGASSASMTNTVQKPQTVTITEPAKVKLEDLFKEADVVATVKIVSGDSEHYPIVVYKTKVTAQFKGTAIGETVFLGPFTGYRVGFEYLVFLRHSDAKVEPTDQASNPSMSYGPLPLVYRIMYEGSSIMPITYECVFDGKETSERCDYGIEINTNQVTLPKTIKTAPLPSNADNVGDKKWVRRDAFLALLGHFKSQKYPTIDPKTGNPHIEIPVTATPMTH